MKSNHREIKEVIHRVFDFYHLKVEKILLFGSRSKGQYSNYTSMVHSVTKTALEEGIPF